MRQRQLPVTTQRTNKITLIFIVPYFLGIPLFYLLLSYVLLNSLKIKYLFFDSILIFSFMLYPVHSKVGRWNLGT